MQADLYTNKLMVKPNMSHYIIILRQRLKISLNRLLYM